MDAATQPAAPHDAEEYQQQIDNIFSLKRPRDIRAGLASGGKSALKGIAAGTVGLLAAPIVGAYTDGLKGFGQGIAAGALSSGQPELLAQRFSGLKAPEAVPHATAALIHIVTP